MTYAEAIEESPSTANFQSDSSHQTHKYIENQSIFNTNLMQNGSNRTYLEQITNQQTQPGIRFL